MGMWNVDDKEEKGVYLFYEKRSEGEEWEGIILKKL